MKCIFFVMVTLFSSNGSGEEKRTTDCGLFVVTGKDEVSKRYEVSSVDEFEMLFPQLNVNGKWDMVLKLSEKNLASFEDYRKENLLNEELYELGFYFDGELLVTHEVSSGKVFFRTIKLQGFEQETALVISKYFKQKAELKTEKKKVDLPQKGKVDSPEKTKVPVREK